jgi:hypothetical protein
MTSNVMFVKHAHAGRTMRRISSNTVKYACRCPTTITPSFPLQFESHLPLSAYTLLLSQRTCLRRKHLSRHIYHLQVQFILLKPLPPLSNPLHSRSSLTARYPPPQTRLLLVHSLGPVNCAPITRPLLEAVIRHPNDIRTCAPGPIERWRP